MISSELEVLLLEAMGPGDFLLFKMALESAAKARKRFNETPHDDPSRGHRASMAAKFSLQLASAITGGSAIDAAYGRSFEADAPRALHLHAIHRRLMLVREFGRHREGLEDPSTLASLGDEILAVANGDEPQLLARTIKSSKSGKRFRLARHQLRALQWIEFLNARHFEPRWIKAQLTLAFMNAPYTTILGWRKIVGDIMGEGVVRQFLTVAESAEVWPFSEAHTEDDALHYLSRDGEAFRLASKASLAQPPTGPLSDL